MSATHLSPRCSAISLTASIAMSARRSLAMPTALLAMAVTATFFNVARSSKSTGIPFFSRVSTAFWAAFL